MWASDPTLPCLVSLLGQIKKMTWYKVKRRPLLPTWAKLRRFPTCVCEPTLGGHSKGPCLEDVRRKVRTDRHGTTRGVDRTFSQRRRKSDLVSCGPVTWPSQHVGEDTTCQGDVATWPCRNVEGDTAFATRGGDATFPQRVKKPYICRDTTLRLGLLTTPQETRTLKWEATTGPVRTIIQNPSYSTRRDELAF